MGGSLTPSTPFDGHLGVVLVRQEDGTAEVALDLEPHHLNRRGVAHGGVITSLLDSALGAAVIGAMPAEWWCATTSLSTQFVSGAGAGRVTAHGRVLHRGGRVAFAAGEARDAGGRLVATAQGTWHLWPHHPGSPREAGGSALPVVRGSLEPIRPSKILAVGRNYADHAAEMNAPVGGDPVVFLKPPSALVRDGGVVRIPVTRGQVHHEVELVAVIGRRCRAVSVAQALDHVLGFAVGLDLTLRDVQGEAKRRGEPWTLAKGFDGAAPLSDVAPREEVGDGSGLEIVLEVNGTVRQRGNTSAMLRTVGELVAWVSRWMTLERGDLLFTGTPAGVSAIVPGDRLEARLAKVGSLSVVVEAEQDLP